MWLAPSVAMARYGTQFWLEETTTRIAKYTLVAISEVLNVVELACMDMLNV